MAMKGVVAWVLGDGSRRYAVVYRGSTTFENLPSTLTKDMTGYTYNITDDFTTDSRFVEGAGKNYTAGTNVAVINTGTDDEPVMKFDAGGSFVDFSEIEREMAEGDAVNKQLLEDTVGFESYNEFIPSLSGSYDKGVTLTINANKTISLSGTATMTHVLNVGKFVCKANTEYILSGCPSGGGTGASNYWLGAYIVNDISDDRKDIGNGCTFSFNVDTEITIKYRVPNGYVATGVTLYPMITKPIYAGFPYQPHHPSVDSCKQDKTLSAQVEGQSTVEGALGALSNADKVTRQLIDDTVGWTGKNKIDLSDERIRSSDVVITLTDTGIVITNTDNGTWKNYGVWLKELKKNTDYVFSCTVTITSGGAHIVLRNASAEFIDQALTAGDNVIAFNTGDRDYLYTLLYCTTGTAALGNVTYSNVMICTKEQWDSSHDFVPYHASVERCKTDNSVIAPVENGTKASQSYAVGSHAMRNGVFITWKNAKAQGETINDASDYDSGDVASELEYSMSSASLGSSATNLGITLDSTANYVAKCGHIVEFRVRFIVAADIATGSGKAVIQLPYVPLISSSRNMTITKRNAPYEIFDGGVFYIDNLGNMIANDMNFTAGTYDVNGMFICQ